MNKRGIPAHYALCDYQATQQGALSRHKKSVHQGFKYPCTICGYEASWNCKLYEHMQTKHKG